MTKSAMAVPGLAEGQVNTVKMDGSQWSKLTLLTTQNLARSYCKQLNTNHHHHHHHHQVCRHSAVLQCCNAAGQSGFKSADMYLPCMGHNCHARQQHRKESDLVKQRREILDIYWWLQSPRYGFQTKQLESKNLYNQKIADYKITPCRLSSRHFSTLDLPGHLHQWGPNSAKQNGHRKPPRHI